MSNYRGIEGARAWLAWIVVFTHLVALTGVSQVAPLLGRIQLAGDWAVQLFVIISGFVISHLLLARREPYLTYITRRAFRLFPAYLVALLLAIAVLPATVAAFDALPWHDATQILHFKAQSAQLHDGLASLHVLLHALMLHGAVPNTLLPESEYMFLTPAWSVSLEWQFYLVAPVLLAMLVRERLQIVVLLLAAMSYAAYRLGLFGQFYLPSFLPGAIGYFLVGMGTRLAVDKLPALQRYPTALVSGCLILALSSGALVPIAAWVALMSYALLDARAFDQPDSATRWLRRLLDSPLAVGAGMRSYSVYILHWVVISLMMCLATIDALDATPWQQFGLMATGTVLLTIIGAEVLYRWVEMPAIAFGKRFTRKRAPLTQAPQCAEGSIAVAIRSPH
ncbi:acyltransferase family protein [Pseudomonas matsuisoli]|uniref:Acyltransferase n=1 Tax=Pseudomonas matsuisoli TaxID=1515666 RepID=A0A917PYP3_9PSED|nr:acyltransferase [Pseudomonas matsuisoli]GGK00063.1 acyltransferase [Pseudomonas matsuisoli]